MTSHGRGWLGAALVFLVGIASGTASAEEPVRRALVVAFNGSEHPRRPPLHYADDDGLLWAEALERLGFDTTLLTLPDTETARRRPPMLERARPPTSAALRSAVERISRANREDRDAGRASEVLVVYVGHGDIGDDGRAFLTLVDRELDQAALYSEVIDALDADFIHLLVDACHASGVVGSRGEADAKALRRLQGLLEKKELQRRPHVGVAFAESDTGQTHEWSRWRAGVFSHLARSALLGGADINGDERVEYSELQSFVAAAMAGLEDAPSRLRLHTLPPAQDPRRPLRARPPSGPVLVLPPGPLALRLSIEDAAGTRLVDVHRAGGERLRLALPSRERYRVRTPDGQAVLSRDMLARGLPTLEALQQGDRGPLDEGGYQGLFLVPFGRAFYEGFSTLPGIVPVDLPEEPRPDSPLATSEPRDDASAARWEVGVTVSRPPLGAEGTAVGLVGAWRARRFPWRPGIQAAYSVAPRVWLNGGTLHRLSLLGTLGVETTGPVSATAEVGAGWALIGVTAPWGSQADLGVLTSRIAGGLRFDVRGVTWRVQAHVVMERARRDQGHHWDLAPGGTVALAWGR